MHAKSHGLLRGTLHVLTDLSPVLAQGIAANPKTYPMVIRLSTTPGDILDDSVSTPRALALKIIGVEGARLSESDSGATRTSSWQTFLRLAPRPPGNSSAILSCLPLRPTRPRGQKAASAVLRGLETVFEAFGHKSPTITSLGGQRETHILGDTFYSQAPLLFGPYMAKVCVASVSSELRALADAPLSVNGKPNGISRGGRELLSPQRSEWELRVQLCTDLEACRSKMPPCTKPPGRPFRTGVISSRAGAWRRESNWTPVQAG